MEKIDLETLQLRIEAVLPTLNEYQRRRYLSAEAKALGRGGISAICRITGVSHQMLREGIKEINNPEIDILEAGRSRKKGGGRKPVRETQLGILDALKGLLEAHTKGDPMRMLLWTNKSLRNLAYELKTQGFKVSYRVVGDMLKMLGYSLQANKKTLTVTPSHADRNAQFEYINTETIEANEQGNPVLSIDAKKKENIGNFKNNGSTYQQKGNPTEVLDHDFPIKELGKATPFGVYNVFRNQGFVNVGISKDTAVFAVESIRRWWYAEGVIDYSNATEIVITADCGGSNGNRNRLWKCELQTLATEIGKTIRILHYPPGCSKWNKIEHRLFSFISKNWQGVPLCSLSIIVSLIGATRTNAGLFVTAVIDENTYNTGAVVTDEMFEAINILRDDFHGEWNYRILPVLA
jgi:transposase